MLTPEDVTLDGDLIRIGGDSVVIKTFISSTDVAEDSYTSRIEGLLALGDRDAALEVALSEDRTATLTISTIGGQSTSFQFCDYLSARKAANKIDEMINGTYADKAEGSSGFDNEMAGYYHLHCFNIINGRVKLNRLTFRTHSAAQRWGEMYYGDWYVRFEDLIISASPSRQNWVDLEIDPNYHLGNYPH